MSDQSEEVARLEEMNSELKASLARCRRILRDCREMLAANSNDQARPDEDDESRAG